MNVGITFISLLLALSSQKTSTIRFESFLAGSDSAQHILQGAIRNIDKNLARESYEFTGFYREIVRTKDKHVRLIEAHIKGIDNNTATTANNDLKPGILQLRKSDDLLAPDLSDSSKQKRYAKNGLNGHDVDAIFANDYIRNRRGAFYPLVNAMLNDSFLKYAAFKVSHEQVGDVPYYRITVSAAPNHDPTFSPAGAILVRKHDLAIMKMEIMMNTSITYTPFSVPDKNYFFHTTIEYAQHGTQLYLKSIHRIAFRQETPVLDVTTKSSHYLYDEKLFVVEDIQQGGATAPPDPIDPTKDLYLAKKAYDAAFWNSWVLPKKYPLSPDVVRDLEAKSPLSDQFSRNQK